MLKRHGDGGGMVCVVTTVKDSQENLDRFVERNLAAGADHLFMFVDDADQATAEHLSKSPHVTAVRTGAGYWQGDRPSSLNKRQWINANLTNVLLTAFPEVAWLFHLDGDESLDLDRERLLALPQEVPAVRLRTLETVASESATRAPDTFKRPLERGELALLAALDVISRPDNKAYYHGHTGGKSGQRPTLTLRLGVHGVQTTDRVELEPFRDSWLNVLHYDAFSPDEFMRKWSEHLRADNLASFRGEKERLRAALATLLQLDVHESLRRELVLDLYRRHVADDVDLLDRLGFLTRPEPSWHRHRPRRFARAARQDVNELLDALRAMEKARWFSRKDYAPERTAATWLEQVGAGSARDRLRNALPGVG